MIKVGIFADVVFDLIIKLIDKTNQYQVKNYQFDNIVGYIKTADEQMLANDIILIHSDLYFHRHDNEFVDALQKAIAELSAKFSGTILVANCPTGIERSDIKNNAGKSSASHQFYNSLTTLPNCFILDFESILLQIGINSAYHFGLGHLYQMPYVKQFTESYTQEIIATFQLLTQPEKKLIITDCDNTLWGGILGEDGIENIKVNKNADGITYYNYQLFLKQKLAEGFLLGIASKNNEADVQAAFEQKSMPLKWNDFVVKKINWQPKHENIKAMAKDLNIGSDSFIFVDDSDFEVNSIQELMPEITCYQFSPDYKNFLAIAAKHTFKRKYILAEDQAKTIQYQQEALRKTAQNTAQSFEEYIESLEIKIDFYTNESSQYERLAQLTEKTNQFNCNKQAYTPSQLADFAKSNYIFSIKVADKYGDYGIVSLILLKVENDQATIENYLMSCRTLGRNIEFDFYHHVLAFIENNGWKLTEVKFAKTEKNQPAQDFLKKVKAL